MPIYVESEIHIQIFQFPTPKLFILILSEFGFKIQCQLKTATRGIFLHSLQSHVRMNNDCVTKSNSVILTRDFTMKVRTCSPSGTVDQTHKFEIFKIVLKILLCIGPY